MTILAIHRIAPLVLLAVSSCAETSPTPASPTPVAKSSAVAAVKKTVNPEAPRPVSPDAPRPRGGVTRMPLGTLFNLQQSGAVLIYDVRPGFIYQMGHIPGASNWPKSSFDVQLASRSIEMDAATAAGKPVVLYCTDLACPDARDVAGRLSRAGFTVSVLEGGWDAWRTGELPVE